MEKPKSNSILRRIKRRLLRRKSRPRFVPVVHKGRRFTRPKQIVGVDVRHYGRLGNNLIQSVNAILTAQTFRLGFVRLPPMSFLELSTPVEVNGITFIPHNHSIAEYGSFLNFEYYGLEGFLGVEAILRGRGDIVKRYLRPLMTLPQPVVAPPGQLTIHLRSGDIFRDRPHQDYVQPPLSFYKKAIERYRETVPNMTLALVFEDRGNPCVDAIAQYARSAGIDVIEQTGSFEEDMAVLLGARDLVFGRGTFGLAIAYLSDHIQTCQVFGARNFFQHLAQDLDMSFWEAKDGSYIELGSWTNSPDQRRLMLDLQADNILGPSS